MADTDMNKYVDWIAKKLQYLDDRSRGPFCVVRQQRLDVGSPAHVGVRQQGLIVSHVPSIKAKQYMDVKGAKHDREAHVNE